jgi:diacylglycerol kinase
MKKYISSRYRSFGYAFSGLAALIRSGKNVWLHLIAAVAAIIAGLWKGLNKTEWCLIAIAIGMVLIVEALNTALEYLCDTVSRERHPVIKKVKDIGAAAVLLAAMTALVIAAFVFLCNSGPPGAS